MRKGQVSLEYLILLVTVMAIVAVMAVMMYTFIRPSTGTQIPVYKDKANCKGGVVYPVGQDSVEVTATLNSYNQPYDGEPDNAPFSITSSSREFEQGSVLIANTPLSEHQGFEVCELQDKYPLKYNYTKKEFYLNSSSGWIRYYLTGSAGPGPGTTTITATKYDSPTQLTDPNCAPPHGASSQITDGDSFRMHFIVPDPSLVTDLKLKYKVAQYPGTNTGEIGNISASEFGSDNPAYGPNIVGPIDLSVGEHTNIDLPNEWVTGSGENLYIAIRKTGINGAEICNATGDRPELTVTY